MPTDFSSAKYFSYDARSEYIYIMYCKKYPMTRFMRYCDKVKKISDYEKLILQGYAVVARFTFEDLKVKDDVPCPYIPFSKCRNVLLKRDPDQKDKDLELDNGRILYAPLAQITLTEDDYNIISRQYRKNKVAISDVYIAEQDYLPSAIRNHVLSGFFEKCRLEENGQKNTYYYHKTKNRLNGNFGMMYTDPVRDKYGIFGSDSFWTKTSADIAESLEKFQASRNSFLCYQWGVYTTSRARRHHHRLIDAFGEEFCYGDTDSAKGTDLTGAVRDRIAALNSEIERETESLGAYYECKDGTRLHMGVFTREHDMTDFKTLGAKKYAYITVDDGVESLHVTISGVTKECSDGTTSAQELASIDNFREGFEFAKCGGLEARYHDLDKPYTVNIVDDKGISHEVTYGSNISMVDSTYTLGLGNDYGTLINNLKKIRKK